MGDDSVGARATLTRLRSRPYWLPGPWRAASIDPASTHLLMHTIQRAAVWDDLVRVGVHRPPRWDDDHDFAEGYEWMHWQMTSRLPTSSDGIVWLWAQNTRRDLGSVRTKPGDVAMTCRIPREKVLVSHFSDWHCVLNRSLFLRPLPGENDELAWHRLEPVLDDFLDRRDTAGMTRQPLVTWPEELRREAEASWEDIFDATLWTDRSVLQATTHELRAEDVVRAVRVR